jgi:hypothetical protein
MGLEMMMSISEFFKFTPASNNGNGFGEEPDEDRRHLVRLGLRDPELAWETPEPFKERWDELHKGVEPEKHVFPLEPSIRGASNGWRRNRDRGEGRICAFEI